MIAGRKNSAGLLHTPTQLGHTQGLSLGGKLFKLLKLKYPSLCNMVVL